MDKYIFFTPPKNIDTRISELQKKPSQFWEEKGKSMALGIYKYVKTSVPAYKRFLGNSIKNDVQKIEQFTKIPPTSKGNYIKSFSFDTLFPNSMVTFNGTISSTSGTTGEPCYFPRSLEQDLQYAYTAEIILRTQFNVHKQKTLGLVCFGLGAWIGGIFTYKNFTSVAEKGNYPLTLLPIGPNMDLTLAAIENMGGHYDQVILMGYPPFVKDVLEKGKQKGIHWGNYNIKILMAAEGITEGFRKHIAAIAELRNPYADMCGIYGSVELGTMAYEGALSYLLRAELALHPKLQFQLFKENGRMPTLAQYHPYLSYFEEYNRELLCTGYGSSIPLLRYSFPDSGGVISFDEMVRAFKEYGIDILLLAQSQGITGTILKLPFVYVFERPNNTISYRGANIHADQLKDVLDRKKLERFVTGRFTIEKKESLLLKQKWVINIELKEFVEVKKLSRLRAEIAREAVKHLLNINSEFLDQYKSKRSGMTPVVKLFEYQSKTFFSRNGKQQWVSKN